MWDLKILSVQQLLEIQDRLAKTTTRGKLDDLLTIGLDDYNIKESAKIR